MYSRFLLGLLAVIFIAGPLRAPGQSTTSKGTPQPPQYTIINLGGLGGTLGGAYGIALAINKYTWTYD